MKIESHRRRKPDTISQIVAALVLLQCGMAAASAGQPSTMKVSRSTNRRQFLKTAGALTTFSIVPRHVLGGPGFVPPSEKVNVAIVGAGGRGLQNMRGLFAERDAQIIAVADPAESYSLGRYYGNEPLRFAGRRPATSQVEKHYATTTPNFRCAEYEDFRVMLEKEKAVDAVLCSTPDHSHAHVCILAMRVGKHVYCEKPLTHNIWEARHVARVARETEVATQMGNQGHSTVGIRETVEYLHAGAIGRVREVHAWVGASRANPALVGRPQDTPPVPAGLDWDLWLGSREPRPFHPAYFPVGWRHFWAFGNGRLGDFGCHDFDAATWAFDLQAPLSVEAFPAGSTDVETSPSGEVVYFEFAPQSGRPALKLTFHGGGLRPRAPEALGSFRLPGRGVLFIGSEGAIQCDGAGGAPRLFPDALRAGFEKPAPSLSRSPGHLREWLDACKGGPRAGSDFDYGARLTEIALLGALAVRTRRRIEWDAESMQAKAFPEAETLIREPYRVGWNLQ